MVDKIAEISSILTPEGEAAWVAHYWTQYNNQRAQKMGEWAELKKYLFATDTSTTSNSRLPWKNSTTLPKLTQIRDNLHSNYLAAMFPNEKWLQWQAYTAEDASHKKKKVITAYIENKARMGGLRTEVSKLLYDYIDYGNVFGTVVYERRYKDEDGIKVPTFIGPRLIRISPEDIVFNPLATSFKDTFKIVRSVKTLGEIKKLIKMGPENAHWQKVLDHRNGIRKTLAGYTTEDFQKASQYSIDGFGNLQEYYMSNYVEILEFYGDYNNQENDDFQESRIVTVADRSILVRNVPIPTYDGVAPIFHVGWRLRPDNLWAMGPLDNLIGMQYRIDHLENAKADAFDLTIHAPLKIIGQVEEFTWGPGAEIHIDEGGDVQEVLKNLNAIITADNQIELIEAKMELYAGAPREAMGVRSPGEKTALEIQTLNNAAGRIFQEKASTFELVFLEDVLNAMLESARRNMDSGEVVSTLDSDLGAVEFMSITRDDIVAKGVLRPIGARHFAQQAQDLQNVIGIFSSPIGQMVAPHTSAIALTNFINDVTNLTGYNIFRPNVAIDEQQETQGLMNQVNEDLEVQATVPSETLRMQGE